MDVSLKMLQILQTIIAQNIQEHGNYSNSNYYLSSLNSYFCDLLLRSNCPSELINKLVKKIYLNELYVNKLIIKNRGTRSTFNYKNSIKLTNSKPYYGIRLI